MGKLDQYINQCDNAIDWVEKYKPEQFDQLFLNIVDNRRVLKQLKNTLSNNPAIAAYGVSQVGKSYLMSNLLQDKGKPFIVKSEGKDYDFINEMNPRTMKTEATGVVTRFSSFKSCPQRYKEQHPIMMRALNVADLALILTEGYFNDVADYSSPMQTEIEEFADRMQEKYRNGTVNPQSPVTPDDVLDMKQYLGKHINNAQTFKNSCIFDKIALIITKVPTAELPTVFEPLWNYDPTLTDVFRRLVNLLQGLNFNRYVYLPAEALLHHENNENTIMSVVCLNGLLEPNGKTTDVFLCDSESNFSTVAGVNKSELAAICAEVVVKIPENLFESEDSYSFEMIPESSVTKRILGDGKVRKEILEKTDLLDFPGARTRQKELAVKLKEPKVLSNVILRGKVAYLFNKYCEDRMINILIYCHHNENNNVPDIPLLLNEWVNKYVGATPEIRDQKLQNLNGISPLFYVATMFNIDMKYNENSREANQKEALDNRWNARFKEVLLKSCFGNSMDWHNNWCARGEKFNNSFLLRDYKFSGTAHSHLFEGFNELQRETAPTITPNTHTPKEQMQQRALEYYDEMRRSFINHEVVKALFKNPEVSWDVAATINNDGSLYIIDKLSQVSNLIVGFRNRQCDDDERAAVKAVYRAMADFFVSQDHDVILRENIRKAKTIHREMDMACNADNYFFGHLIQKLQIPENVTLNKVQELIEGTKLNNDVQTFSEYEIIYTRCLKFEGCENDDQRWERLIRVYGFQDQEEAEQYLRKRIVEPEALFRKTYERKKNSYRIAKEVLSLWQNRIQSIETFKEFTSEGQFDSTVMGYLVDQLLAVAKRLDLEGHISDTIAQYVNVTNISTVNKGMLTDLITQMINEFVTDFGFRYLDAKDVAKAEKTAEDDSLDMSYIHKQEPDEVSEDYITSLFNGNSEGHAPLAPAFENHYFKWLEYIVLAFIANLTFPDYNMEANDKLALILEDLK